MRTIKESCLAFYTGIDGTIALSILVCFMWSDKVKLKFTNDFESVSSFCTHWLETRIEKRRSSQLDQNSMVRLQDFNLLPQVQLLDKIKSNLLAIFIYYIMFINYMNYITLDSKQSHQ